MCDYKCKLFGTIDKYRALYFLVSDVYFCVKKLKLCEHERYSRKRNVCLKRPNTMNASQGASFLALAKMNESER